MHLGLYESILLDSEDFYVVSTSRHAQLRNTFMFSTFISLVTTIFFVEVIHRLRRTITWKFSVRVKGKTCHLVVEDYLRPTELKIRGAGEFHQYECMGYQPFIRLVWGYVPEPYNENWITRIMKFSLRFVKTSTLNCKTHTQIRANRMNHTILFNPSLNATLYAQNSLLIQFFFAE